MSLLIANLFFAVLIPMSLFSVGPLMVSRMAYLGLSDRDTSGESLTILVLAGIIMVFTNVMLF